MTSLKSATFFTSGHGREYLLKGNPRNDQIIVLNVRFIKLMVLQNYKDKEEVRLYVYDYRLPYYEWIGAADADEAQMLAVVCVEKKRPGVNVLWRQVPILGELTKLTEELWGENANGRLNALRLKKSINQIKRKFT